MSEALSYVDKKASMWADKDFVLSVVQSNGNYFCYAAASLKADKTFVQEVVAKKRDALLYVDKKAPMWAEEDFVLPMVQANGEAFEYVDKQAPMWAKKAFVLSMVNLNGPSLKYATNGLNQDADCLKASGLWDSTPQTYSWSQQVTLSVKFSLAKTSTTYATNFALAIKRDLFFANMKTYNPNVWCKNSCDPKFTNINHPCRGTLPTCMLSANENFDTCTGRPCGTTCWRVAFRYHLEECKASNGFMIQVEEKQGLGDGQDIEAEMARQVGLKVFKTYTNVDELAWGDGYLEAFRFNGVNAIREAVKTWMSERCVNRDLENVFVGNQMAADHIGGHYSFNVRRRYEEA